MTPMVADRMIPFVATGQSLYRAAPSERSAVDSIADARLCDESSTPEAVAPCVPFNAADGTGRLLGSGGATVPRCRRFGRWQLASARRGMPVWSRREGRVGP